MADQFDAYHKWLGISPEKQPPNLYQLLGVDEFESDLDVIESAADQRMAHLRTLQSSKHAKLSQQLLNEISAARVTLLNPDKKAAYDEKLRQELGTGADDPLGPSFNQLGGGTTLPAPGGFAPAPAANVPAPFVSTKPIIKKKPTWILPVGISVSALVILGVVIVIILVASNKDEGEGTVAEQPAPQQTDQSPHDQTIGGKTDGSTIGTDTPKNAVDGSADGQTNSNGLDGQNDSTTNNGETSNPVKTNEPPRTTETTTPEKTGTNDTSTHPVEPPKPIEIETPKKQPLPTDEQQKPVLATLEETFKLSEQRSSEDELKLAAELLKLAGESKDSVEKFVLLRGAMNYAGEGGNAQLVMSAVNEIDRHFEMDRFDIGQKALIGFCGQASTKEAFGSLADAADKFVEESLAADRVDVAMALAEAVYGAMVEKSVASDYRKQAYDQRNRVNDLYSEWKTIQDAFQALRTNPEDPKANTLVGKWFCFKKNDWKSGLSHLVKSSDEPLKSLAVREINSPPMTSEDQVALADDWWSAAENAAADVKEGLQLRAGYWYRNSLADLQGFTKTKAEKRIDVVAHLLARVSASEFVPKDVATGKPKVEEGPLVEVANAKPIQVKEGAVGFSSSRKYGLTGWPKVLTSGYVMLSGGHEYGNTTQFKVLRNGKVFLIMSGRPNGGGGGGDWQQRIVSPQQLLAHGWRPVGNVNLEGSPPCVIYERVCRRGEEFTYSWEKYIPPVVVVPDWRLDGIGANLADRQPVQAPKLQKSRLAVSDWVFRYWMEDLWKANPTEKSTASLDQNTLTIKNTGVVHSHARFLYQQVVFDRDFTITGEVKGDIRSLGLVSADGQDRSYSFGLPDVSGWHRFTFHRTGTKITAAVDGTNVEVRSRKADATMPGVFYIGVWNGKQCAIREFEVEVPNAK